MNKIITTGTTIVLLFERPLAQATETARLCAALREESALDLIAALTATNP